MWFDIHHGRITGARGDHRDRTETVCTSDGNVPKSNVQHEVNEERKDK